MMQLRLNNLKRKDRNKFEFFFERDRISNYTKNV
jgi:hypothetical protein